MADLDSVDTFLGFTEESTCGAAHLHADELRWRAGIDNQQVDLVAADTHVSRHDVPTQVAQVLEGSVLGRCSSPLPFRSHNPRR